MNLPDYLEQQKQYTEFLDELDALFRKHNIEHVYATDSTIHISRSAYDTWTFGSWVMRTDGTRRYTRPGITEYILASVAPEVSATVEPLDDEPVLQATVMVPEPAIEPIKKDNIKDNTQAMGNLSYSEEADPELTEQEINPKIEEYINDLADRLYTTAKSMGFPKNVLGEYWTHPKVVMSVKKAGFNESAYMIISANTTYWHKLADRMKLVELLDKQQEEPESMETTETVETLTEEPESVAHMETFSTDTILGTWTVHYSDYKDSVYIDSDKGRTAIIGKVHNWMLIFSRMHPELKNAPTRANISDTLTENFDKQQSFRYKWYEFIVDVSYSTPIDCEENNNA